MGIEKVVALKLRRDIAERLRARLAETTARQAAEQPDEESLSKGIRADALNVVASYTRRAREARDPATAKRLLDCATAAMKLLHASDGAGAAGESVSIIVHEADVADVDAGIQTEPAANAGEESVH